MYFSGQFSQSYDDIKEDIKLTSFDNAEYIGKTSVTENRGEYINGIFNKTCEVKKEYQATIKFNKRLNSYLVSFEEYVSGSEFSPSIRSAKINLTKFTNSKWIWKKILTSQNERENNE